MKELKRKRVNLKRGREGMGMKDVKKKNEAN